MSDMMDPMPALQRRVGKCLKRLRELIGDTVEDAAEACGETKVRIRGWENGDFTKDTPKYIDYIYENTKQYKQGTVPEYFKDYYFSKEVQDRLKYYKTLGYAFLYMRKQVLGWGMERMARECGFSVSFICSVEHNDYVGRDGLRKYANYIYSVTGPKCNHKVLKIANELIM